MFRIGFVLGMGFLMIGSVFAADSAEKPNTPPPPPPGMGHRGPPPEALEACKGKKADEACEFIPPAPPKDAPKARVKSESKGDRKMTGKCWTPDASKPLACKPAGGPPLPEPKDGAGGPPPHDGKPPKAGATPPPPPSGEGGPADTSHDTH